MAKKNLIVGQSGGPTAVINSSLYGVVSEGLTHPDTIEHVYGMVNGIEGFLNDCILDFEEALPGEDLDGDVTGKIKMSSEYYVQADVAGEYPMVYQVANSAGDVQKLPVTVEIYDPSKEAQKPQFELSEYLVYTSVGNAVDPWSYVQQITMGGIKFVRGEDGVLRDPNPAEKQERTAITADEVQITNQADFNTPGTYEILYQITDDSGKESVTGQVRLIVVVR